MASYTCGANVPFDGNMALNATNPGVADGDPTMGTLRIPINTRYMQPGNLTPSTPVLQSPPLTFGQALGLAASRDWKVSAGILVGAYLLAPELFELAVYGAGGYILYDAWALTGSHAGGSGTRGVVVAPMGGIWATTAPLGKNDIVD